MSIIYQVTDWIEEEDAQLRPATPKQVSYEQSHFPHFAADEWLPAKSRRVYLNYGSSNRFPSKQLEYKL